MKRKVYLIETEFTRRNYSTLGFSYEKPYEVIDESKKKFNIYISKSLKTERRYKVRDDYGNVRWMCAEWFCEIEEFRDDKIKKLLD